VTPPSSACWHGRPSSRLCCVRFVVGDETTQKPVKCKNRMKCCESNTTVAFMRSGHVKKGKPSKTSHGLKSNEIGKIDTREGSKVFPNLRSCTSPTSASSGFHVQPVRLPTETEGPFSRCDVADGTTFALSVSMLLLILLSLVGRPPSLLHASPCRAP
jgi:hypothetical protein